MKSILLAALFLSPIFNSTGEAYVNGYRTDWRGARHYFGYYGGWNRSYDWFGYDLGWPPYYAYYGYPIVGSDYYYSFPLNSTYYTSYPSYYTSFSYPSYPYNGYYYINNTPIPANKYFSSYVHPPIKESIVAPSNQSGTPRSIGVFFSE